MSEKSCNFAAQNDCQTNHTTNMKDFKDYTISDFSRHSSMHSAVRSSNRMPHVSYFKAMSNRFRNINNPSSELTEAILNVPTVALSR